MEPNDGRSLIMSSAASKQRNYRATREPTKHRHRAATNKPDSSCVLCSAAFCCIPLCSGAECEPVCFLDPIAARHYYIITIAMRIIMLDSSFSSLSIAIKIMIMIMAGRLFALRPPSPLARQVALSLRSRVLKGRQT